MSDSPKLRRIARATVAALALGAALSGCGTHFIDARTLARGCAFGGGTPEEDADQAKHVVAGRENSCTDHVAAVARRRPGAQGLYTTIGGIDHVSALVDGHVLDNGALGLPGDVMALDEFRAWYGADFEIGGLPDRNPDWNVAQLRQWKPGRE